MRVALERDEKEPGVQLASLGVEAVCKGVAAAQDLLLLALAGELDVGVGRDQGLPPLVFGPQIYRVELVFLANGSSAVLVAADAGLLLA